MLLNAAKEMGIDLSRSWMVGDKLLDVKAGQAAGCRTILLRRSAARSPANPDPSQQATYSANNLSEALDFILKNPR